MCRSLTVAVVTTMPTLRTLINKTVAITKVIKATKTITTMINTTSKELLASTLSKVKVVDGAMTQKKTRKHSATSP